MMDNNKSIKDETVKASKAPMFSKTAKVGTYTVVISLILIAALVVLNLIVSALPVKYTVFDTTASQLYTISAESEEYLKSITEPVTVYFICSGGTEDRQLRSYLDRFAEFNKNITLKTIDPVADPTFLEKYTTSTLSNFSLIIESSKRFQVIDYNDLYYVYNEAIGQMSYSEYEMYSYSYPQYFQSYETKFYFNGDSKITTGIEYTQLSAIPSIYILTGHSEAALSQKLLDSLSSEYFSLDIRLDNASIPDNASLIIINAPVSDITDGEAAKLKSYLAGGGNVYLTTNNSSALPKLMGVLSEYGLSRDENGLIYEGNADRHVVNCPYYIYPFISTTHQTTSELASYNYIVYMPNAHGIKIADTLPDGVTVTKLFTTSDTAYTKNDDDTENKGEFTVGAAAESTTTGAKIVWISCENYLTDNAAASASYGNYYYFLFAQSWMSDVYTSTLPEIAPKTIENAVLTVSEGQATIWGAILIFVIPLVCVIWGIVVCVKRRRR